MRILVTGSAGFIGFHLSQKLLKQKHLVIGVDNLNNYYSPQLKQDRLAILKKYKNFHFYQVDISQFRKLDQIFTKEKPELIVNLAAQAGVRYSLTHPFIYQKSNTLGFLNILELMRKYNLKKLVYASSSSVYGSIKAYPFKESMHTVHPISLYAATKLVDELYAYTYHHLFGIKSVGLRFFTVYGPWGRPDMVAFKIIDSILNNTPIDIYGRGNLWRDFTYIDDIVAGINKVIKKIDSFDYEILNLGNSRPVRLAHFIQVLEQTIGKKANKNLLPKPATEVYKTYADTSKAKKLLDWQPTTNVEEGLKRLVRWYRRYYRGART